MIVTKVKRNSNKLHSCSSPLFKPNLSDISYFITTKFTKRIRLKNLWNLVHKFTWKKHLFSGVQQDCKTLFCKVFENEPSFYKKEYFLSKVSRRKKFSQRCFPANFAKTSGTLFHRIPLADYFCFNVRSSTELSFSFAGCGS